MSSRQSNSRAKLPFSLAVCGLDELDRMVPKINPTHVVSITDPDDHEIEFPATTTVLRLAFHDVHAAGGLVSKLLMGRGDGDLPCIDHAQAILDFGRRIPPKARVLVHCHAGVSRSTAAAFLLLCLNKPGDEARAYQFLRVLRPQARPNRLIVKFGDKLLGANGRMVACL